MENGPVVVIENDWHWSTIALSANLTCLPAYSVYDILLQRLIPTFYITATGPGNK